MRTLVMGILNVTPDSFSDGGRWGRADVAVARGLALVEAGADLVDIGGESTRPGATPVTGAEEWERIGKVVETLVREGVTVSVDTYHADTARRAADAGVAIINDVTGGKGDPEMFAAVAASSCEYVLQHGRGDAQTMNSLAGYTNIGTEVTEELRTSVEDAVTAGISRDNIIVDPGFGFAKIGADDWNLAAHMGGVLSLGHRVLVGVSRKRFLADIHRGAEGPLERDDATAALTAYFAGLGVWGVRVHEVAASRAASETIARLSHARVECDGRGAPASYEGKQR